MIDSIARRAWLACTLALFAALTAPAASAAPDGSGTALPSSGQWSTTVAATEYGSMVAGNPHAPVKLVEFVSYTCPHCAELERESSAPLRDQYIASGKVRVEVRSFIRGFLDVPLSLLARCGDPSRYYANHSMLLQTQESWSATLQANAASVAPRLKGEDFGARNRDIVKAAGLYDTMIQRGYTAAELDACLADEDLAKMLENETNIYQAAPQCFDPDAKFDDGRFSACIQRTVDAIKLYDAQKKDGTLPAGATDPRTQGVNGTPNFMLDGVLLKDVYDWAALRPLIDAKVAAAAAPES